MKWSSYFLFKKNNYVERTSLGSLATHLGWALLMHIWTYRNSISLSHSFFNMLSIFMTLCNMKWDGHSFLNQRENSENNGHMNCKYALRGT